MLCLAFLAQQSITLFMQPAPLWRRLAALFYDLFLLLALWFATAAVSIIFTGGEAAEGLEQHANYALTVALITVTFLFYGWFWTHGGQTLGMRVWKVKAVLADGNDMTWRVAFLRMLAACFSWGSLGLGYLWALIDPAQRTWHDQISGSAIIFQELKKPKIND